MKTNEQMTADLLKRKEEYDKKQLIKRRRLSKIAAALAAVMIFAALSTVLFLAAKTNNAPAPAPAETATETVKSGYTVTSDTGIINAYNFTSTTTSGAKFVHSTFKFNSTGGFSIRIRIGSENRQWMHFNGDTCAITGNGNTAVNFDKKFYGCGKFEEAIRRGCKYFEWVDMNNLENGNVESWWNE